MINAQTPVLIGVGQVTEKDPQPGKASSPLDLIEQAAYLAARDAGIGANVLSQLDELVIVKSFRESTRNSPEALANRIGATNARQWLMPDGGNGPQYLVNRYSQAIADAECNFVLFAGSEAMATGRKIVKTTGEQPDWQEPSNADPRYLVEDLPLSTAHEKAHGIWAPTNFYAMSENALRHQRRATIADHQRQMGRMFAEFTKVAAGSPHAWYPIERSAEEIATPTVDNRFVAWPYTKYMNAMNQINQSAALLLTSVENARRLGVAESRFIYIHGCADTNEIAVSQRANYHHCVAMQVMAEQVFAGSDLTMADIDLIDFYSCFPSAVAMAQECFGLKVDDPRALTVTGGLPFHGGAGNNYVMNSIAAMAEKLRANPGQHGLVTANGGYFSKHSAGIYSTTPVTGQWRRTHPQEYQNTIDAGPRTPFSETPGGQASIETYTVNYGRDGEPAAGYVIGRLGNIDDPLSTRFLAMLPDDRNLLRGMTAVDMIGTGGVVRSDEGRNTFTPA